MPKLRDVDSLRARSVKGLADYVHEFLKVRGRLSLFMNGAWESAKRVTCTSMFHMISLFSELNQPPKGSLPAAVQPRPGGPLPRALGISLFAIGTFDQIYQNDAKILFSF